MASGDHVSRTMAALTAASIDIPASHIIAEHPAVMKSDEHLALLQPYQAAQPAFSGRLARNLFLKDKKTKQLYLVSVLHSTTVDYKTLGKLLGAKELRMEEAAVMEAKLGVTPGSVTPLAVMNDAGKEVQLVLEKRLAADDQPILVHPLINTATLAITWKQLQQFATAHQHEIKVIDIPDSGDAAAAPAAAAAGAGAAAKPEKKEQPKVPKPAKPAKAEKKEEKAAPTNTLGIDKKKDGEFAGWYSQVVTRSEMIDYYDISGCYILRPWSYKIWDHIRAWFNERIELLGVENSYFPLFVSKKALEAEKDHVEGFAPEVAWVTRSGDTELDEPIAVRPTSETIMYPSYSKWIRSHRDLPLKLNQWSNVVRWEFKFPTPFIRSREFLWQEGHTAFATKPEADEEVLQILDLYAGVYEQLLAVPVTKGKKTEAEKFAGGLYTTTVEAFIPATGRGIQGATSHCLGQNFAHMFDIQFESKAGSREHVWQNSWGLTTRTIGVMVMVHGDDKGLVLPPAVAPQQVVIVPIYKKDSIATLDAAMDELARRLRALRVRVEVDKRDNYNPGWKFAHWEVKGVPLRIEVGSQEVEKKVLKLQRRDKLDKQDSITLQWDELEQRVPAILADMQADMLRRATEERDSRRKTVTEWAPFLKALDGRNTALAPHCSNTQCEKSIKVRTGEAAKADEQEEDDDEKEPTDKNVEKLTGAAKTLCIPFEQPQLPEGTKCIGGCGAAAVNWTLFGRSY